MAEYIVNPRRAPRAAVRCEARVALSDGGFFAGPTVDLGPGGCQVTPPHPLNPGARVFLELAHSTTPVPFRFSGRVAWAKSDPAPRAGIAFDDAGAAPARLFGRVTEAAAPAGDPARAPDRISVEAALAPARPLGQAATTPEEALVLEAVGDGLTVGALRAKLGEQWAGAVNAVFALLGQELLVIVPSDPASPGAPPAAR